MARTKEHVHHHLYSITPTHIVDLTRVFEINVHVVTATVWYTMDDGTIHGVVFSSKEQALAAYDRLFYKWDEADAW